MLASGTSCDGSSGACSSACCPEECSASAVPTPTAASSASPTSSAPNAGPQVTAVPVPRARRLLPGPNPNLAAAQILWAWCPPRPSSASAEPSSPSHSPRVRRRRRVPAPQDARPSEAKPSPLCSCLPPEGDKELGAAGAQVSASVHSKAGRSRALPGKSPAALPRAQAKASPSSPGARNKNKHSPPSSPTRRKVPSSPQHRKKSPARATKAPPAKDSPPVASLEATSSAPATAVSANGSGSPGAPREEELKIEEDAAGVEGWECSGSLASLELSPGACVISNDASPVVILVVPADDQDAEEEAKRKELVSTCPPGQCMGSDPYLAGSSTTEPCGALVTSLDPLKNKEKPSCNSHGGCSSLPVSPKKPPPLFPGRPHTSPPGSALRKRPPPEKKAATYTARRRS
eukprot:RCo002370